MLGESQIEAFTHTNTVAMKHSHRVGRHKKRESVREKGEEGERK